MIDTVPNDGTHTDTLEGQGPGTYTYEVCQAGPTVCSNETAVRFGGRPATLSGIAATVETKEIR